MTVSASNATPEQRLSHLGLVLPPAPQAVGNYAAFVLHGGLLAISGQLSRRSDGTLVTGRAGDGATLEEAQEAARLSAMNILAQAKAALGELGRIEAALRLTGFVQAAPHFIDHAKVVNGASDLLGTVLGASGIHSRVAVGAASLPMGALTEIDALFAVT